MRIADVPFRPVRAVEAGGPPPRSGVARETSRIDGEFFGHGNEPPPHSAIRIPHSAPAYPFVSSSAAAPESSAMPGTRASSLMSKKLS